MTLWKHAVIIQLYRAHDFEVQAAGCAGKVPGVVTHQTTRQ